MTWMRRGTIINAKIARDARTSPLTTIPIATGVNMRTNGGLITTAAGMANPPRMSATSHATATIAAVFARTRDAVRFMTCEAIFRRGEIENTTSRNVHGYVAATS